MPIQSLEGQSNTLFSFLLFFVVVVDAIAYTLPPPFGDATHSIKLSQGMRLLSDPMRDNCASNGRGDFWIKSHFALFDFI